MDVSSRCMIKDKCNWVCSRFVKKSRLQILGSLQAGCTNVIKWARRSAKPRQMIANEWIYICEIVQMFWEQWALWLRGKNGTCAARPGCHQKRHSHRVWHLLLFVLRKFKTNFLLIIKILLLSHLQEEMVSKWFPRYLILFSLVVYIERRVDLVSWNKSCRRLPWFACHKKFDMVPLYQKNIFAIVLIVSKRWQGVC